MAEVPAMIDRMWGALMKPRAAPPVAARKDSDEFDFVDLDIETIIKARKRLQGLLDEAEARQKPKIPYVPHTEDDVPIDEVIATRRQLSSVVRNGFKIIGPVVIPSTERTILDKMTDISDFNRREFIRVIKSAISVDVFLSEPWLVEVMRARVAENVRLIRSADEVFLRQVEETVWSGLKQGYRHEVISGMLQDRVGVAESRADLIARDQTNKFNGELTKVRQEALGIQRYIRRSCRDERVRDSHRELDGKVYTWADGGDPEEGHPGEAIGCRCSAEAIFDDLL